MMHKYKIYMTLSPTNPSVPLGIEVWVDKQQIFNTEWLDKATDITGEFDDDNTNIEHDLRIILKNKKPDHTTIDENGKIVSDALVEVLDIQFDEISIKDFINNVATYTHNFNGHGQEINEPFQNLLGCNGTVSLKFNTPIYLWLLEYM